MATISEYEGKKGKSYRVQIRHHSRFLKNQVISRTFHSLTEAKKFAREMEKKLGQEAYQKHTPQAYVSQDISLPQLLTMAQLIDRYENEIVADQAEKTRITTKHIYAYWRKAFGSLPIKDVTPTMITTHKKALLEKGLATGTCRHYFLILNALFNVAVEEWELLPVSPMKKVRKPPPSPDRTNYLTEEQCEQFLTACKQEKNPCFYPIITVFLATGARRDEVLWLRMSDINVKHHTVSFHKRKNKKSLVLPLNTFAWSVLSEYLQKYRTNAIPDELVFPSKNITTPAYIREIFENIVKECGFKDVSYHTLRHTLASHLVMKGTDLLTVSQILGHTDLDMVRRYAHLSTKHLGNALEGVSVSLFQ